MPESPVYSPYSTEAACCLLKSELSGNLPVVVTVCLNDALTGLVVMEGAQAFHGD